MTHPAQKSSAPAGCLWTGFFALFAVAGLMVLIFGFAKPAWQTFASRSWVKTSCLVLDSKLDAKPSDEQTVYKVVIRYRYDVAGKSYESDRYDFSQGHTNVGMTAMRDAVELHPAGATRTCYVDPNDPSSAVINQSLRASTWIALPFSGVFLLVGVGGLAFVVLSRRKKRAPRDAFARPGTLETFTADSVRAKAVGVTAVALFWNGIVTVFLIILVTDWDEKGRGGLACFLAPFVLAGAGVMIAASYYVQAALGPRPRVTVSGKLAPGETLSIDWEFPKRVSGLKSLVVTLAVRRLQPPPSDEEKAAPKRPKPHWSKTLFTADPLHVATTGHATAILPPEPDWITAGGDTLVWSIDFDGKRSSRPNLHRSVGLRAPGDPTPSAASGGPSLTIST